MSNLTEENYRKHRPELKEISGINQYFSFHIPALNDVAKPTVAVMDQR